MRRLASVLARWAAIESERGVTAIEYALVASMIAFAIVVGATLLGINLNALFGYIAGVVEAPGGGHGGHGGRDD